jgi:hypothetical protein
VQLVALTAVLFTLAASAIAQSPRSSARPSKLDVERYSAASIDANGNLQITTTDGKSITVPKEGKQTAIAEPFVSTDRAAVGATGQYENCCTSYDIPLQLIIYSGGRVHRYSGALGLAIFEWHFVEGGRRVAFGAQTVHFGCAVYWRLVDIRTDRLVDEVAIPEPCSQVPDPKPVRVPAWAQAPTR